MRRADVISRQIKLRHLQILVEVARQGSMVKAGEHLGMSQPVVSKAISDLERSLGVELLDRLPQGVEPTLYGRALIKRSVAIFDDLRTSVSEIEFLTDPMAGEVRIGATEGMAVGLLPIIIGRLGRRYPRISFEVIVAHQATLLQRDLPNRQVDLVIGNFSPDLGEGFAATVIGDARQHVVVGTRNRWSARKTIGLADLAHARWCLPPPNHPVRIAFVEECQRQGVAPPQATVTVGSPHMVATMVAQFGYLGLLGAVVMQSDPRRHRLRKLPIELPMRNLTSVIVTLKNRTLSPVTQLFIEAARTTANGLSKK